MVFNLSALTVMSLTVEGRETQNGSSQYINRFHFVNDDFSIPNLADLGGLIASWVSAVNTAYLACLTPEYVQLRLVAATVADPDRIKVVGGTVVPGTRPIPVGGQFLPPYCAHIVSWSTGLVSRRYNGKTYIGQALESDQDKGEWEEGNPLFHFDLVVDWVAAMIEAYGNDGSEPYRLAILSDPDHVLPALTAPLLDSPTAATVSAGDPYHPYVGTQKRRAIGRGA